MDGPQADHLAWRSLSRPPTVPRLRDVAGRVDAADVGYCAHQSNRAVLQKVHTGATHGGGGLRSTFSMELSDIDAWTLHVSMGGLRQQSKYQWPRLSASLSQGTY
jgi:hypothetical protein